MLTFGTVCSGIGAPEVAWSVLGWRSAFASEIESFPRAVLAHHHKEIPLHGDFTTIRSGDYADIDILCGGTPCQSFSVAGLRGGMEDARGNLALEYIRLAARLRPRWLVWENVPGVRSSNKGRDFGSFLGGVGQLGYGWAYRSFDAQYFDLAQRRERVFVVGYLGDWRRAAAVLFEPASLRGDTAPSRQAGENIAPTISARTEGGGGLGTDFDCDGGLIANQIGTKWRSSPDNGVDNVIVHALRADGFDASEDGTGRGTPLIVDTLTSNCDNHSGFRDEKGLITTQPVTLAIRGRGDDSALEFRQDGVANAILTPNGGRSGINVGAIAFAQNQRDEVRLMDVAGSCSAKPGAKQQTYAQVASGVRRLTPRECERLMGFPDDYTLIPWRKKMAADGPRYKALGNSMAVPVMRWIGQRIAAVS